MFNPISSTQLLQPMSSNQQKQESDHMCGNQQEKATTIGATWSNSGNLKIDLDNLLTSNKNDKGVAPSMNQLASNPTSPINQPRTMTQNNAAMYGQIPIAQNYQQNFAAYSQPNNFYATFK